MEFVSGGGKVLELAKALSNAVTRQGGDESHLLSLLKQGGEQTCDVLAMVLIGTVYIQSRPLAEIARDYRLPLGARVVALREAKNSELAYTVYKEERSRLSSPNEVTGTAIRLIKDEEKLLEIVLTNRKSRFVDNLIAVESISDSAKLEMIAGTEFGASCRIAERLSVASIRRVLESTVCLSAVRVAMRILFRKDAQAVKELSKYGEATLIGSLAREYLSK